MLEPSCRLVGKDIKFFCSLIKKVKKHIFLATITLLFGQVFFSCGVNRSGSKELNVTSLIDSMSDAERALVDEAKDSLLVGLDGQKLPADGGDALSDSLLDGVDSTAMNIADSTALGLVNDSLGIDSAAVRGPIVSEVSFLDDIMTGKNRDSMLVDLKANKIYIYREGEISYQEMSMKGDYMEIDMKTKDLFADGYEVEVDPVDSLDMILGDSLNRKAPEKTRPEFIEGDKAPYSMESITYNFETEKAIIKGITTQEGEGFLIGDKIKKMPDGTFNIQNGVYTTCDNPEPHFCIKITKGKMIPGKKIVTGPAYLNIEGVDIPFLGLPFAFFPVTSGRQSGFIIPQYGEESVKGFFIREGGYYFAINDYIDITALGGFYTLGSWEASVASRYIKRYKYSGGINVRYSKDIIGEKEDVDYVNTGNFSLTWSHSQDPKFRPNSTFSASVNFSSSGFSKYGSTNMDDYLNTQTNSSIAYSKSWAGTPFSLSTNMQHSQNSRDTTISLSLPNVVFNMSSVNPFKRREAVGKERWYEKISLRYTGNFANNVTVKEDELFTEDMLKKMKNGAKHSIPISTSFNLLKYINVSPNANYNERWYFSKVDKAWDEDLGQVVNTDTTYGFYRVYDYNYNVAASTKLYGTYQFGPKFPVQAIRHVITPNISIGYTPDFGAEKFGYYKPVQSNADGDVIYYSPYEGSLYGVPGRGESASLSFGLSQTLEMKVKSDSDTSGVRKIKLIENLSATSSYNFLADSLNLAPFSLSLRTTLFKNFGLNISATLDPYTVDPESGRRLNKFMLSEGKIGRITSASWSFGYTFNSRTSSTPAVNDINSGNDMANSQSDLFSTPQDDELDANTRRTMMTAKYYDFDIPWNFGFNYSLRYSNNGVRQDVDQTLGFTGSITLSKKWGTTFNGGYDFKAKELTPGTVTISRDLHCWQMGVTWVPIGYRKSWSFNIGVKSSMLQDIKYDKRSSHYDNLYD